MHAPRLHRLGLSMISKEGSATAGSPIALTLTQKLGMYPKYNTPNRLVLISPILGERFFVASRKIIKKVV
jgi:hypothetical protein